MMHMYVPLLGVIFHMVWWHIGGRLKQLLSAWFIHMYLPENSCIGLLPSICIYGVPGVFAQILNSTDKLCPISAHKTTGNCFFFFFWKIRKNIQLWVQLKTWKSSPSPPMPKFLLLWLQCFRIQTQFRTRERRGENIFLALKISIDIIVV